MNRKLFALAATASTLAVASQANAALVISPIGITGTATFSSDAVVCVGSPCTFSETITFASPGYNLIGGTLTSGPALTPAQDITFGTSTVGAATTATLNGIPFILNSTGVSENATTGAIGTLALNTLTIAGTAGASGLASYSGTLNFANRGVPEPAIWAMMLLGFGMIGFAMRRRPQYTTRVNFAMS
jgi:hypothetical protein